MENFGGGYWTLLQHKAPGQRVGGVASKAPGHGCAIPGITNSTETTSSAATRRRTDPAAHSGLRDDATLNELGEQFGIVRQTVAKVLKRHGVAMRQHGLASDQINEAVRLYETGWSLAKVGEHLGVDDMTVHRLLTERGVTMRSRQSGMR